MGASARKDYVGSAAKGTLTLVSAAIATKATGTVTLASAVANTFAFGTVTLASALAGDTVTVNGLLYTGVAGAKANNTEFSIDTSDTAAGIDLADSINNDARVGTSGDISATESTGVVTMTSDVAGVAGNAITLVSSNGTRAAVTGSGFLTGGVDAMTVTVNGLVYTAVAGAKANDTQFSIDTSDNAAATDLADSIDDDVRVGNTGDDVTATAIADTVTIVAVNNGTRGNSISLASSDGTALAVSAATLTGGINGDDVYVNGLLYTAVAGAKANDTEYSIDTSDAAASIDLADSIDDDIRVGTEAVTITSTGAAGVVTIVSAGDRSHAVPLVGSANVSASGAFLTLTSLLSNIDDSNQTYKQVNFMNTPYSVQSSGVDKFDDKLIVVNTEAIFNTLTVRSRVLWGNREGWISAFIASTSLTFTWLDKTKTEIDTVKTMAEVLASGSMVFLNEDA
jgi:hypothetical protein